MKLVTPTEKGTLSIGKLIKDFFVPPTMFRDAVEHESASSRRPERANKTSSVFVTKQSTREVLNGAFLQTFGFDSYDPTNNTYTTAYGNQVNYNSATLPLSLALTSFFGLPNRPDQRKDNGTPILSIKQAFKDWIGGWNPLYYEPPAQKITVVKPAQPTTTPLTELPAGSRGTVEFTDEQILAATDEIAEPLVTYPPKEWYVNAKTILQIPALLIKILIIFPIKLITWPFKIALNIVKLFTEFLPLFVANVTAQQIGKFAAEIVSIRNRPVEMRTIPRKKTDAIPLLGEDLTADDSLAPAEEEPSRFWPIAGRVLLIGLLGIAHYTTRVISLVGRALTSPEISARMAFTYGRGLKIETSSEKKIPRRTVTTLSNVVGFILGSVGALVSLALSATLWAIMLPLTIGTLLTFIPQAVPLLNWFAQLPVVAASLSTVSTTFGTVATLVSHAIGSAFAPAITALSALIPGLVVSTQAIAVGATLGIIFAPVASILSRVANVLSDLWANWNPTEGKTFSNAVREALGMERKTVYTEVGTTTTHSLTLNHDHVPTTDVQKVVSKAADAALSASKVAQSISALSQGLELSHDIGCAKATGEPTAAKATEELVSTFCVYGGQ